MPRALITGAHGFVGPYLARHLRTLGDEVWGTDTTETPHRDFRSVRLDVRARDRVSEVLEDVAPDEIYHLAAISRPTHDDVAALYEVNLLGTVHVLEAARDLGCRVLMVSSSYVYGSCSGAVHEETPLEPTNPYGASKAAAEMAAISAAAAGLEVVRVRPFTHTGPGQPAAFFVPTLVEQLAAIRDRRADPELRLGNLDPVRDVSDVRDVVRAYPLLLRWGEPGQVYNVGRGVGVAMREIVRLALDLVHLDVDMVTDPSRLRPLDLPELVADVTRLHATIDWHPEHDLRDTLRDMLAAVGQPLGAP